MATRGFATALVMSLLGLTHPGIAAKGLTATQPITGEISLDYWPFCDLIIISTRAGTFSAARGGSWTDRSVLDVVERLGVD